MWAVLCVAIGAVPGCECKPAEPRPAAPSSKPARWSAGMLPEQMARVSPLHKPMAKPRPGDWLSEHDEPGQTFDEYCDADPIRPELDKPRGRNKLYIQPLGALTSTQRKIVALTSDYMMRFFGVDVRISEALSLDVIPDDARRRHPEWGNFQILSTYVLHDVLKPRLPADAVASISFTATDLWPGKGWNFVFGQASLRDRVGVWSINRNGDPDESPASFRLALRRTLKTAVHETGHMFSMQHCTAYQCVMNGSNNREESDRQPLWLCPHCMAKISWAAQLDPVERYARLAAFVAGHGLAEEEAFFRRSAEALQ